MLLLLLNFIERGRGLAGNRKSQSFKKLKTQDFIHSIEICEWCAFNRNIKENKERILKGKLLRLSFLRIIED